MVCVAALLGIGSGSGKSFHTLATTFILSLNHLKIGLLFVVFWKGSEISLQLQCH